MKTLVIYFGPALEECGVQGDFSYDQAVSISRVCRIFLYQRADTYSTAGRDPRKIIRES